MDFTKKLEKAVLPAAQQLFEQIQDHEQRLKQKKSSISELQAEAQTLETQAQGLREKASEGLGGGTDPREALREARELTEQAEELSSLVQGSQGLLKSEEAELQALSGRLRNVLCDQIDSSDLKQKQAQSLLEALRQVVAVFDTWNSATEALYQQFGLEAGFHQLLDFGDDSEESELAPRVNNITSRYQGLFKN